MINIKTDMFGVSHKMLLAMLKRENKVNPIESDYNRDVLLVQTPCSITRIARSDTVLSKYELNEYEPTVKLARNYWQRLEFATPHTRLNVTNIIQETETGTLLRKFVATESDHVVWLPVTYLNMFEDTAWQLRNWLFESIPYCEAPIEHCPVRISKQEKCTSGYTMPYNVYEVEKVFK